MRGLELESGRGNLRSILTLDLGEIMKFICYDRQ